MRLIATVLLAAAATTGFQARAAAPGPNTNTPSAAPKTPIKSADLFGDIVVAKGDGTKCERCWHWETDVGSNPEHPTICGRCVKAINQITVSQV